MIKAKSIVLLPGEKKMIHCSVVPENLVVFATTENVYIGGPDIDRNAGTAVLLSRFSGFRINLQTDSGAELWAENVSQTYNANVNVIVSEL